MDLEKKIEGEEKILVFYVQRICTKIQWQKRKKYDKIKFNGHFIREFIVIIHRRQKGMRRI